MHIITQIYLLTKRSKLLIPWLNKSKNHRQLRFLQSIVYNAKSCNNSTYAAHCENACLNAIVPIYILYLGHLAMAHPKLTVLTKLNFNYLIIYIDRSHFIIHDKILFFAVV